MTPAFNLVSIAHARPGLCVPRVPKTPAYDERASLNELLADPLVQMVMRADGVTKQQLVKSIGVALSKLGAGSSPGTVGEREEVVARDYRPTTGVILLNKYNLVFVGRRRHAQNDVWAMPQGDIKKQEDPRTAALRQLKETIGTDNAEVLAESKSWLFYDLPVGLTGRVRRRGGRGQRQKWFAMRFKGSDEDIDIKIGNSEFCEWKWVGIGMLPKLIVSFKRLVYLGALEEFLDAVGPYDDES